jgi:hypothetical protein
MHRTIGARVFFKWRKANREKTAINDLAALTARASQAIGPKTEGAGNAGRISAPAASCAKVKSTRGSHHRFA